MFDLIADHSLVILIVAGVVAGVFLYLVDHFKTYVLDGTRDPVRITSLRYVQIFTGFVTISLLIAILAIISLVSRFSFRSLTDQSNNEILTLTSISGGGILPAEGTQSPVVSPIITPETSPTPAQPPSATPAVKATIANTGGAGANMRSIPGLEGVIITSVNEGTEVTVVGQTETMDGFTWQLILLPDGRQGWVVSNYLIFQR